MGMYFPCACTHFNQEINIREKKASIKVLQCILGDFINRVLVLKSWNTPLSFICLSPPSFKLSQLWLSLTKILFPVFSTR